MNNIVLLFDKACIYEIVILNYFLKFTGKKTVFCSIDEDTITSMEGYSLNIDTELQNIHINNVPSIIIPGGDISRISNEMVYELLRKLKMSGKVIAGICAGVDVLEEAGILQDVKSTHSTDMDIVRDEHMNVKSLLIKSQVQIEKSFDQKKGYTK